MSPSTADAATMCAPAPPLGTQELNPNVPGWNCFQGYHDPLSTQTPPDLVLRETTKAFLQARDPERTQLRRNIVRMLLDDPNSFTLTKTVLEALVQSNKPGRLDDAVDILSQTQPDLYLLASSMLMRSSDKPQSRRDDYFYVIIRSLGRTGGTPRAKDFALWASSFPMLAAREAVVQALGELEYPWSRELLQKMATNDPSDFIRDLARETIEENVT